MTDSSPSNPPEKKKRSIVAPQSNDEMLRLVAYVLAALMAGGGVWRVLGVATAEDVATGIGAVVEAHDEAPRAHPVPGTNGRGVVEVVVEQAKEIEEQKKLRLAVVRVTNAVNDSASDDVADKAEARIKDRERAREVRKIVKARSMANLGAEPPRPARDGLDAYFE